MTEQTTVTSTLPPASRENSPPGPTQSGVAEDCQKWYLAHDRDGCSDIANSHGITLDPFYNGIQQPHVRPLPKPLAERSLPRLRRRFFPSTPTTTFGAGGGANPLGPTQSGIPSDCSKYALAESGKGCYDLAAGNGISLDDLWKSALYI
ncbi:hypothetical protein PWT90_01709 [Aphanocladium album]|nr:hypothetical protein PWT90_01709 [Aphanocladium album]